MAVLELSHVSKRIGKRLIIDDISMTVEEGEIYGFLGPNGAGKTTTIRMIMALASPTQGSIKVLGHDIHRERSEALAQVGAIVENPETYSYLTGRQNLLHYARLAGIKDPTRRIEEVGNIVNLRERLNDKVKRYSLGMRQRLGVAQALLANPKLLVLDEPTNGLDPAGMREFREMMRNLADSGMSVFVSSHLLSEIQLMCDRVAVLKQGRIIAERRVDELVSGVQSGVSLEVSDASVSLEVLKGAGVTAQVNDDRHVRASVESSQVPGLVRALVSANVDIFSIEPIRDTLEEAFLQMTEMDDSKTNLQAETGGRAHG
ncbi:ABC transporter ATP-binding protein [Alicyclobacillus sp. SO9]|uniref:ABC transporter ATP-binding protein n=1 Tax=Alicyclobacillus sp. SO9 TaxID=2665646 RepID=UPI001E45FDAE|nr:ABC transporter ATP-binding protein [Alicyclobacillus sp. SO9]